jgi:hypothetical protein
MCTHTTPRLQQIDDRSVAATRYRRRAEALWRVGDEFAVIADVDGNVVTMGGSAVDVWIRLALPQTIDELVRELASDYGADPDTVRADVVALLEQLQDEGFLSSDG